MEYTVKYYWLYFALILVGVLLYGVGNFLFGKAEHGGKRLVILVAGLLMFGITGMIGCGVASLWGDASTWLGWVGVGLLALFGLAGVVCGVWFLRISFSRDAKKVLKAFEAIINGV